MELKKIKVFPYNPEWPKKFEEQKTLLSKTLGSHCLEVHHIGSTSIPGLAAKEDLDILCIVDRLENALELEHIGYVFKGELNIPLRWYFSKNSTTAKVNLHVVESGHGFIEHNLCFRDYLRTHAAARDAYQALKYQLLQNPAVFERVNGRFPRYTLEKNPFINTILQQAGHEGTLVSFCTHYQEWENYHRIRETQIFKPIQVNYDPHHASLMAENHYHLVLARGTEIVCVAHVEFLNDQEAALRSLATDETHQRQGYGTQMLAFLEKWIHHRGRKVIKMHANLKAAPFYRKLGYAPMVFDDPCIGEEYVDLGKTLGSTLD